MNESQPATAKTKRSPQRAVHAPSTSGATMPDFAPTIADSTLAARASFSPSQLRPSDILSLQRSIGNQQVVQLLRRADPAAGNQSGESGRQVRAPSIRPPSVSSDAPNSAGTATRTDRIQRTLLFGMRTVGKSTLYKGAAGGKGSQQKLYEAINMTVDERADRLAHLLSAHFASNKNRFNQTRQMLVGGGGIEAAYKRKTGTDLRPTLQKIFGGRQLRIIYLEEILNNGEPSEMSLLAERVGALDLSKANRITLLDKANRDNVVAFIQTMKQTELQRAVSGFPKELRFAVGRRGWALIEARLKRQNLDSAMQGQGVSFALGNTTQGGVDYGAKLLDRYEQEAIAMVRLRMTKLSASSGMSKFTGRKGGLRKSLGTDQKRIVKELRDWSLDKDPAIIKALTERRGRLHTELRRAFGIGKILARSLLSNDAVQYVYAMMNSPDATNPEHAIAQIKAVLTARAGSKIKPIKRGAAKEIEEILDQVDHEDLQRILGRDGIAELEMMSDKAMLDILWQKSPLHSSPNKRAITMRLRHGKGAKRGGVYDKLWQIQDSKLKQADFLRVSQKIVNIIQHELDPESAEFELIRSDGELLRGIKSITTRLPGTRKSWSLIRGILDVPDVLNSSGELGEFRYGSDYNDTAKSNWANRDMASKAAYWAGMIDIELNSVISKPSTVLIHLFKAQEDAEDYAREQAAAGQDFRGKYGEFMQAINGKLRHTFRATRLRFGLSYMDKRRILPTLRRIRLALSGDYDQRLQLGDLLDATKSSMGKIRTDKSAIRDIIDALSGVRILQAWTNFPEMQQTYQTVKAMPEATSSQQQLKSTAKQQLANQFVLMIRPEFWDKKLESLGMGAFGEVDSSKKERKHVTFRDLLKRSKRVDMERTLLDRVADEAEGADEFQEIAGWLANVDNQAGGPKLAAKYFANRTRAIGLLESAQLLSTGMQWSYFSTSSTQYKGTQTHMMGLLREDMDLDPTNTSAQERMTALQTNVDEFDKTGSRLASEEKLFRNIQKTFNARVRGLVTTVGAIISAAISAGIAAVTWGGGAPVLITSITAGILGVVASLATAISAATVDFVTKGQAYSHIDSARKIILDTIDKIAKAGLTLGVKAFTAGLDDIIGTLGTAVLAQLIRQLGIALNKDTRNVIDRFFETSNFKEFADRMQTEVLKDVLSDVKVISKRVGMVAATGGIGEAKMAITGEEPEEDPTAPTKWEAFTKGDKRKEPTTIWERLGGGAGTAKKRGMKSAKKKAPPLIGKFTSYVESDHDTYLHHMKTKASGQKGGLSKGDLMSRVLMIAYKETAQKAPRAGVGTAIWNMTQSFWSDCVIFQNDPATPDHSGI